MRDLQLLGAALSGVRETARRAHRATGTNFDGRSLKLNDEANLNIYDREFARQQSAIFDADIEKSHLVTYDEWLHRPRLEKLIEKAMPLLDWQL